MSRPCHVTVKLSIVGATLAFGLLRRWEPGFPQHESSAAVHVMLIAEALTNARCRQITWRHTGLGIFSAVLGVTSVPDLQEHQQKERRGAEPGHVWLRHMRQHHVWHGHPAAHVQLALPACLTAMDFGQPGHCCLGRLHLLPGACPHSGCCKRHMSRRHISQRFFPVGKPCLCEKLLNLTSELPPLPAGALLCQSKARGAIAVGPRIAISAQAHRRSRTRCTFPIATHAQEPDCARQVPAAARCEAALGRQEAAMPFAAAEGACAAKKVPWLCTVGRKLL